MSCNKCFFQIASEINVNASSCQQNTTVISSLTTVVSLSSLNMLQIENDKE